LHFSIDVSELVDKFVLNLIHHSNDILSPRFNLREELFNKLSTLPRHFILQPVKSRPVLNIPVLGRDQAPGVDRGVLVGDHPQVLQDAALYDRLQGSSILLSEVISEMI
jgi:hypothetical protein